MNCNCGCGDGVEIRLEKDEHDYAWLHILASKWYSEQITILGQIGKKLKKIWWVIRGKDFYHSEIIMNQSEWQEFVEVINKINNESDK